MDEPARQDPPDQPREKERQVWLVAPAPTRYGISELRLLPYVEAVPLAREALDDASDACELGLFLWDDQWSAGLSVAAQELADERYGDAYDRLRPLADEPSCFADLVEAAVRTGRRDEAAPYVADLEQRAQANGSAWCAGVAARSRALVEPVDRAEPHYRSAIELLAGTIARTDLARAHLLYGEWLRHAGRRTEADRQLETAGDLLELAGATMFEARAGRSISRQELTTQEAAIARLAGEGRTSVEIGSELLISPNTVDHHLRQVFEKLGVSSRRQLADLLVAY